MQLTVLKTTEIDNVLWETITREFNRAFNTSKTTTDLISFYQRNSLGYSIHSLAFKGEILIGYNALYPYTYSVNGNEDITIGISGGTFVLKEYRKDIFIFNDLSEALWEYGSKMGMVATLGVSNENSFRYAIEFLNATLIAYLPYYVLPMRLGNIIHKFRGLLNFFSLIFARFQIAINKAVASLSDSSEKKAMFELKLSDQFYFNRFGGDKYFSIRSDNLSFFYRIESENGIIGAYLFDFRDRGKRTYKSLIKAVDYIMNHHKIDIILFIGHLRLRQFLLFRLPWKYEPQHLPLTFNLTSKAYSYYHEIMSIPDNWNFGLMNFDAR